MTNLHELRKLARQAAQKEAYSAFLTPEDIDHIADAVLLVVTQSLKDALQCKHGMPHYCPNCDRSWNDIHADLLVVTQYVEQQEIEKTLSRSDHPSVISNPDQRGDDRGDL